MTTANSKTKTQTRGVQRPTFELAPRGFSLSSQQGDLACQLFQKNGIGLLEFQRNILRVCLHPQLDTVAVSVPRQNGKSYIARCAAIWAAAVQGLRVNFTEHHSAAVADACAQTIDMLAPAVSPALSLEVATIYRAYGREHIGFKSGGEIQFQTRTNASARGFSFSVIIVDEAQEYTSAQQAALAPVILSAPVPPKVLYFGTPPGPDCFGDVFRLLHDTAHAAAVDESADPMEKGDAAGLAQALSRGSFFWAEWAADKSDEITQETTWQKACPSYGFTITKNSIEGRLSEMPPEVFAREVLGYWAPRKQTKLERGLDYAQWEAAKVEKVPEDLSADGFRPFPCFGLKFSPDGRLYALAVALEVSPKAAKAQRGRHTLTHVELIKIAQTADDLQSIVNFIAKYSRKAGVFLCDGIFCAELAALCPSTLPQKYLRFATTKDLLRATQTLTGALERKTLTHLEDPALDEIVANLWRRNIGRQGGYGFAGENSIAAEALALAVYAQRLVPHRYQKKARIL